MLKDTIIVPIKIISESSERLGNIMVKVITKMIIEFIISLFLTNVGHSGNDATRQSVLIGLMLTTSHIDNEVKVNVS